nr:hypothetical protein [Tanacetum cinerariifolium]
MLKGFDREDLVALWNLVKEKFSSAVPSEDKEKALWVELKRLFEPDADDVLWKLQIYMHSPLTWKLYTDCRVHHVSSTRGNDIFMLIEKDYHLSNVVMILMLSGKLQVEEDNEMARDLVMKIFMETNKPRSKIEDEETKLMKETPQELLKDKEKKQLGKNEEAKMTIYNALPRKEYERVFMCKTSKEIWHALIITHQGNSQRAKLMAVEEAKDLASLSLDELIGNLKVYEMVLDNDGVTSKTTKEKVKSLAIKAKVTKEQTSDNSDCQDKSDEDVEEKEAKAFNLLARKFYKFFHKANWFRCGNRFGNGGNRFGKGCCNSFEDKGGESSKKKGASYNRRIECHFASECRKPKENKAFIGGAWSDSENDDEHQNNATCLMAIDSQEVVSKPSSSNIDFNIIDLQKENQKLLKFNKDFTKTFEKLLKEKCVIEDKNSKLSSKINDLEIEVKKLVNNEEVIEPCQKCVELT